MTAIDSVLLQGRKEKGATPNIYSSGRQYVECPNTANQSVVIPIWTILNVTIT